ncbi:polymeric immunoglobulin receptor-like isoform X2 [Mugil cephalus]|uniref:polymeric immunoglobulin receptor-like isoform X2 n=1 Tax=Mugil cephalus TaxID=48193 RepID=UPI001FB5F41A|nr:polymeric immunoglobulin receptor-like isoform X2 [Mugil cephalus]
MWSVQDLLFILCIVLSYVTRAAGVIRVFGYVGRDVDVSCSYGQGYESHEKYLCKNDCGSSDVLITTSETKKNKYSIYDDKEKRSFTVTISDLQSVDAGKYWCGVTVFFKDIYTEVKLELGQDHCCNNVDKIQSNERDSVSIICPYELKYQNNLKFICRGNQPSTCLQQAVITSDSKQNGRFTLTEDKESRRFTVNINKLTLEDSGWYLCGVHRNTGLDVFSAVELEVKDTCCDKVDKRKSYEEDSVSIICPYELEYQNNLKFICRGNQPSTCLQQAVITSDSKQNGRFTLSEDMESRRFTVNINKLTQEDSGWYLCGVHRNTGLDVFSAVELEVKVWCCVKTLAMSGTVTRPVTLQCPYPPHHQNNRKFLCKGDYRNNCTDVLTNGSRFMLQDDVSLSSFSVMITNLEAGDAGMYWCGSDSQWRAGNYTRIHLSVGGALYVVAIVPAVLLILIVALIIVYKQKCHKVQETGVGITRHCEAAGEPKGSEEIYANEETVGFSKQTTSKLQGACNDYSNADDDQPDYENFTATEEIYYVERSRPVVHPLHCSQLCDQSSRSDPCVWICGQRC